MGLFIGRESELAKLQEAYGKGKAILVYGRRRVGKTTLLEKFSEGKRTLYLRCIGSTLRVNLDYARSMISSFLGEERRAYSGLLDMTEDLAAICRDGGNLIVIDEYQYLKKADGSIDSFIQHLVDAALKNTTSTLILCGSSVSIMKSTGEDGGSPLYGRFRHIIRLGPLSLEECRAFHPDMPDRDQLMMYLSFGGIPRYHSEATCSSYREFVMRNCIEDSWIADEIGFLIRSDYPNSEDHEAVLSAISRGSTNLKEIAEKAGLGTKCGKILDNLVESGVVAKVNPMLGAPKRPVYCISDSLMAFYFSLLSFRSDILMYRDPEKAYDVIYPDLRTFMGRRFEFYCQDVLRREYPVIEMGKWWMDDPRMDVHEEIDIVARLSIGKFRADLFVECKNTSRPVGFPQYDTLKKCASRFSDRGGQILMLISEAGFEEDFEEWAGDAGVMLVGPEELYGRRPFPEVPLTTKYRPETEPRGVVSKAIYDACE